LNLVIKDRMSTNAKRESLKMGTEYRNYDERLAIVRSIIAEGEHQKLETFSLTDSEEVFYRARAMRCVEQVAKNTSKFSSYYALPTAKPFGYVVGMTILIVACAAIAAVYIWLKTNEIKEAYPLFSALATITVAAIGWAVAGWISHRNTVRQNTNNLLVARFSQAPFGEALHNFHMYFGQDVNNKVTAEIMKKLRLSEDDKQRKAASSAVYLLNYYEFISSGVLKGDFDQGIVRDNIRGLIIFYHDKCYPYIRACNNDNPRTFENLIRMRTHYRQP